MVGSSLVDTNTQPIFIVFRHVIESLLKFSMHVTLKFDLLNVEYLEHRCRF